MSDAPNLAARIEALPEDVRENLDTIIAATERDLKRRQKSQQERLEMLERGSNSLPVHERLAMHLLGELAMNCHLTISDVHTDGGNLYALFNQIAESLKGGLAVSDLREIKELADQK